ncbi:hypothetical protein, partial [Mucilaginibacter sp. L196]|uniref:hypothetical protein n=1 Tax=Mucilaginibacter sp. L196 TaxID=1641870 RepID=UPI001C204A19
SVCPGMPGQFPAESLYPLPMNHWSISAEYPYCLLFIDLSALAKEYVIWYFIISIFRYKTSIEMSTENTESEKVYKQYLKIIDHSNAGKAWITLALKDNYRQSGRLKNANFSVASDGTVNATVSLYIDGSEPVDYNITEIADVYS